MKDEELKAQISDIIEGEIQNGINDYLEAQEDKEDSGVGFVSDEDKKLASQRNMIRRGEMDIDTSDRGVRGIKARLQGLSPKTGRPEKQPGYSPPVDALGQSYDTSSMSTGNWDWQAPDTPAEQKWKADKYQEQLSSRGGGPSGIGSGEGSDHIDNPYNRYGGENFPGQKVDPANVPCLLYTSDAADE